MRHLLMGVRNAMNRYMSSVSSCGIILSGAYVVSGLVSEFGLLPPAFLPLANKRLYCWQAESLQKQVVHILLALPQNFVPDSFDEERLQQDKIATVLVKNNGTLGNTVRECLDRVPTDIEDVLMLFGDTLISDVSSLPPESLAVGFVQEHSRWGYCHKNANGSLTFSESYDVGGADKTPVVAGCFRLNKTRLAKCLDASSRNFYAALNLYSTQQDLKLVDIGRHWYDFGHINAYFRSRQSFTTERTFNSLKIEPRKVLKSGDESTKILAEAAWYENVPRDLNVFLPDYLGRTKKDDRTGYATEYLFLTSVSDLFVYGRLPEYVWQQILSGCREFYEICASHSDPAKTVPDCQWLYVDKTKERMANFSKARGIELDKPWTFNGKPTLPLNEIFANTLKYMSLSPKTPASISHGDFHFANIFFDFRSLGIKVVDPRGIINGKTTIYGDARYDLAKLAHSVDGLYDFILAGIFKADVTTSYDIDFKVTKNAQTEQIQKLFSATKFNGISPTSKDIRAIVILLFLSMLPLHADNKQRQDTLLANVFRLYVELERA